MKSIEDTLKIIQGITRSFPGEIDIALVGGYAAVLHGVERTTLDIDVCVGHKDASDVVTLLSLMTESERRETVELAKRIGRDRKLAQLLLPSEEGPEEGPSEELI